MIVLPPTTPPAIVQADLRAFARMAAAMTFADFPAHHGVLVRKGVWKATGTLGPSLSRCLVVDLPSLESIFGTGDADGSPSSSGLQCDGPRTKITQPAMLTMAIHAIGPELPGFTMKRYPAKKPGDRSSIVWKNNAGVSVDFIAYGTKDYKDHDGSRLAFVVEVDADNASTPSPAPTN